MKEKLKRLDYDTVFCILLGLFFILLFITTKYSLRLANYVIIPMGAYKIYKNRKYERTGFEYYILAFMLAMGISSIGAFDFKSVKDEFLDTLIMVLVFLSIAQFTIKDRLLNYIIGGGVVGYVYKISISFLERLGYIKGLYGGVRVSGGEEVWRYAPMIAFGVVVILCIMIFRKNSLKLNIGLSILLLLTLEVLVKTQNRGNWVAVICCFILMTILKLKKKAIIPIFLFSLVLFGISKKYDKNTYVHRLNTITQNGDSSRLEIWEASIEIFKKNPINGTGYSYKNFMNAETPEKYVYLPKHGHGHSHNSLLYVLATMGILGILSYIALTLKILWFSFKNRDLDYGIVFFMILSIQIFSFFETPVKYLDLVGVQMLVLGVLYSLRKARVLI
ncbi:MAG: O-antigen ligase family protein [Cetobacterium sp.]|uniref:O-antigen ligase family protein n=1 Tax=Cetobacterium sp. TaxID=2071632 RepID=UPI003EE81036